MLARWLYVVFRPFPWSTTIRFPPPYGLQPASDTFPAAAASTGVLHAPARSSPVCISPAAPVRGLPRSPNGELTFTEASGARRPAEGAETRADFGAAFRAGLDAAFGAAFRAGLDAAFGAAFGAGEDSTWGRSKTSDDPASAARDGWAAGAAAASARTSRAVEIPVGAA